ncbi:MAG: 2-oxoacid:ferredoxin oxidoreductase subunit beta [archaeon]
MTTFQELTTSVHPQWCPGCGNYGILLALKQAIAKIGVAPKDIVLVSGIGCSGKTPHYVHVYGFESIHGRTLPVATAIKLCNHKLTVIAAGGDGDAYGIGLSHFIHAMRRNIDITYVVHNNQVYGLTKGQTSPTSGKGYKSKSTPDGTLEEPINPLTLALDAGATYIARGFAGDTVHLVNLITEGIKHKGFSLIDVFQPCLSFNTVNTFDYYKANVYKLEETKHDVADFEAAHKKAREYEKLPIGLFYKTSKPTYGDGLPQIAKQALVEQDISNVDVTPLLKKKEI